MSVESIITIVFAAVAALCSAAALVVSLRRRGGGGADDRVLRGESDRVAGEGEARTTASCVAKATGCSASSPRR